VFSGLGEQAFQSGQTLSVSIKIIERHCSLQMADPGIQRTILMEHGTMQAQGLRVANAVEQRPHDARLADAGLARQQHGGACASCCLAPAAQQQIDLLRAVDHRRETARMVGIEPAFGIALAKYERDADWSRDALQASRANLAVFEQAPEQAARAFGNSDLAWLCQSLQAAAEGKCLANCVFPFYRRIADHHGPAGDADAGLPCEIAINIGSGTIGSGRRGAQRQCGAHGIFHIVLGRVRIAEIGPEIVARATHHMAAVTLDYFGIATLQGCRGRTQVLQIGGKRQRGQADEFAGHHGQVPVFPGKRFGRRLARCRIGNRIRADCLTHRRIK